MQHRAAQTIVLLGQDWSCMVQNCGPWYSGTTQLPGYLLLAEGYRRQAVRNICSAQTWSLLRLLQSLLRSGVMCDELSS